MAKSQAYLTYFIALFPINWLLRKEENIGFINKLYFCVEYFEFCTYAGKGKK